MAVTGIVLAEGVDDDAYVNGGGFSQDINYNDENLLVGRSGFGTNTYRSLIGLDILGLFPAGTIFDAGTLSLSLDYNSGTDQFLDFEFIDDSGVWRDDFVTWNNKNSLTSWPSPGVDVLGVPTKITAAMPTTPGGLIAFPGFEAFFQHAFDNNGGRLEFRIKYAAEGSDRLNIFSSSAAASEPNRPRFSVTHHVPLAAMPVLMRPLLGGPRLGRRPMYRRPVRARIGGLFAA